MMITIFLFPDLLQDCSDVTLHLSTLPRHDWRPFPTSYGGHTL